MPSIKVCFPDGRWCFSTEYDLNMANELIKDTVIGAQFAVWKLLYNVPIREKYENFSVYPTEEVGWGWFYGFRRRYPEITSKYITNMKHYHKSWSTWAMMYDMYTIIYGLFEQWGSCCKIGCSKWQDTYGNEVPKDEALRHCVKLKLLHPDLILSMDEQGDTAKLLAPRTRAARVSGTPSSIPRLATSYAGKTAYGRQTQTFASQTMTQLTRRLGII